MAIRPTRSKIVSTLEKRLGRALSDTETLRLAAYARAVRVRREQRRIYKPRMELHDDGESPRVTALFELPGLRPDELAVDIVDGRLIVGGERRPHAPPPQRLSDDTRLVLRASADLAARTGAGALQVQELKYGFFRRVVAVPEGCTTSDLEAVMENGMLSVSWPRSPLARVFGESTNTGASKNLHGAGAFGEEKSSTTTTLLG